MATAPAVPHARTGNERGSARQAARGRWRERGKGRLGRGGQGQRWGSSCTAVPARQRDPGPLCEGGMGARCGPQDAVPKMSRARPLVPFSSPESPGTWSVPQWALLAAPWLDLDSRSPGKGRAKWNCETRAWGGLLGSELDDCTPRPQPRWEGGRKLTVPRGPSYLVQRARCEAVGDDRDGIHDAWPRWGADADANAGQAVAMVVEEKVEERKYAATDRCVHQVPHPRVTDSPVWIGKEGEKEKAATGRRS